MPLSCYLGKKYYLNTCFYWFKFTIIKFRRESILKVEGKFGGDRRKESREYEDQEHVHCDDLHNARV